MMGEIIADAVERKPNKYGGKFKWRSRSVEDIKKAEACRFVDGDPVVLGHSTSKL